jgi:predicted transcriptional regulator
MTVVAMSHGELSRYDTLLRVKRRELRVDDAATLLGLSRRQISRLLDRLRTEGAEGLISRRRGKQQRQGKRGADENGVFPSAPNAWPSCLLVSARKAG